MNTSTPNPAPARILATLAVPARTRLRLAQGCGALAGLLLIPQAAAIAWCIQQAFFADASPARLWPALAALAGVGLLRALLAWATRYFADGAVEAIRLNVRSQLLQRLAARSPLWLRQQRSGALSELGASHVDALEGYYGGYLLARSEIMVVPLLILIAVFWVDRIVGSILLVTMPLIPFFMMLVGWGAEAASRQQLQALTRMGGHFADRLRGLGVIRLYGRGAAELEGVHEAAEGLRQRSLKVLRIAFLSSTVMEFFASLSVAMVAVYLGLTYLGMLTVRGEPLTLGVGLFCLLLAPEFYAPLRRLATHYHDRANALAAVAEIEQALDAPADADLALPPPAGPARPQAPSVHAAGLVLRPLGASQPVLQGIDFEVAAGSRLALVGPSGCGKSTLLEALAGWLPPEAGTLQLTPATATLRIGYASQRPFLFHGSLRDNLRMARPEASEAELRRAADAAQVSEFAARLPQGWDTPVGERGFGLSGGEARRIALARIFLREPDLLLLDEPTAFLDPDTEARLLDALEAFCRGRTLVMATHSDAAMRMAGQCLWLPQGRLQPAGEARA